MAGTDTDTGDGEIGRGVFLLQKLERSHCHARKTAADAMTKLATLDAAKR
jgi:hypothetical protein